MRGWEISQAFQVPRKDPKRNIGTPDGCRTTIRLDSPGAELGLEFGADLRHRHIQMHKLQTQTEFPCSRDVALEMIAFVGSVQMHLNTRTNPRVGN